MPWTTGNFSIPTFPPNTSFCNLHVKDWIKQESSIDTKSKKEFWWGAGYLHSLEISPFRLLISYKERKKKLHSTEMRNHLNQMVKINFINGGLMNNGYLQIWYYERGKEYYIIFIWPWIHNRDLITEKQQTNAKLRMFY